jgi:hypothetical protein
MDIKYPIELWEDLFHPAIRTVGIDSGGNGDCNRIESMNNNGNTFTCLGRISRGVRILIRFSALFLTL